MIKRFILSVVEPNKIVLDIGTSVFPLPLHACGAG